MKNVVGILKNMVEKTNKKVEKMNKMVKIVASVMCMLIGLQVFAQTEGNLAKADLNFREPPEPEVAALLAACASSLRRAGLGRTRGSGRLIVTIWHNGKDVTTTHLAHFRQRVQGGVV